MFYGMGRNGYHELPGYTRFFGTIIEYLIGYPKLLLAGRWKALKLQYRPINEIFGTYECFSKFY